MGKSVRTVFKRLEKKYLLSASQYEAICSAMGAHIQPDEYGEYTICNVYLDTANDDLIRRSVEKPVFKEKLRVRSYGVPNANDRVFLEIKRKCKGSVYKRRVSMTSAQLQTYLETGEHPWAQSQIFSEIDWFMRFYAPVPKLFLAYDRVAFRGTAEPTLRITFDKNIRYRRTALDLSAGADGELLLPQGQYIMEIKTDGAMPLWLCEILSTAQIYPTSFSKYGNIYKKQIQSKRGA